MKLAVQTLAAVNQAIEAGQEDGFRNHLGASVIGKKCARESWYKYRWGIREHFNGQQLRLFDTGNVYEPRFVAWLRAAGLTVWPHDPKASAKAGKPVQWRVSAYDGHFGGSLDGIGTGSPDLPPNTFFSISFKTHNEKSFEKLVEMGVMGSKWEHFIQEQVYMHLLPPAWGIKICLYVAANKNTDQLHFEWINYDPEVAKTTEIRAGNVIYSNEPLPRIANSPGAYACKFCVFNRLCHFGDVTPDRNCRTCSFARPAGNGVWACGLRHVELDQAAQKADCGSYQVNPKFQGVQA
jgi:hypothetical protein